MDDRVYYLLIVIIASTVAVTVMAGVLRFDIPAGFWAIPSGALTLLVSITVKRNGNNKGGA